MMLIDDFFEKINNVVMLDEYCNEYGYMFQKRARLTFGYRQRG